MQHDQNYSNQSNNKRTKPVLKLCLTIKLQEDGMTCPVIGSKSILSLAGHVHHPS
jgi:hypothetical protein